MVESIPRTRHPVMRAVAVALLTSLPLAGCYNTYVVPSEEFRKLQSPAAIRQDAKLIERLKDEETQKLLSRRASDAVTVTSVDQKQVAVTRDTRLYVRSQGGRRYQVTPFNYSMYSSQLVASDRDALVPLANLKSYEIDLLSTGKTAGAVAVGVALAAGFIAYVVASSGKKTFN
jgi:hypothetical protein